MARPDTSTAFGVLAAISVCHLINDMLQSMLPSIYPILKAGLALDYGQIGLITLTYQIIASVLQPLIGHATDRRPQPLLLAFGMGFTLVGLLLLSVAHSFSLVLMAAALVGAGSAVFHPESSRIARVASGGRHGFAQSVFQVGGNAGSAMGPLLAAFVVVNRGQSSVAWFAIVALAGMIILFGVGRWYREHRASVARAVKDDPDALARPAVPHGPVRVALFILVLLMFSKFIYMASLGNYYTFFLIEKFGLSVQRAQLFLFAFLGAVAAGTIIGGPLGDRFGRKHVIWWSIAGVLPFTLALPYANLFWTGALSVVIGVILASAFPAILVFAQELVPGRVGMVSGLFFGFAFGIAGVGAAILGALADRSGIAFVYRVCAFLPALGLLAAFLPDVDPGRTARSH